MSEAAVDLAQDLDRCEGSSERGVEGRLNDDRYIENKPLRVWTRMDAYGGQNFAVMVKSC